ncbi:hypothetical protein F503_08644 [Ophiostoma piceae UAMH 11346]|uniref:CCHC-type domain-containing protein n=1 Tax=Ophiostoma piceae (strain UAMH 11346) TaxID=1262450 RepID=S3CQV3_OPHP1|nr:hypothetical protein F503_08644 [Ophiostoma piceae UAMH 11346]
MSDSNSSPIEHPEQVNDDIRRAPIPHYHRRNQSSTRIVPVPIGSLLPLRLSTPNTPTMSDPNNQDPAPQLPGLGVPGYGTPGTTRPPSITPEAGGPSDQNSPGFFVNEETLKAILAAAMQGRSGGPAVLTRTGRMPQPGSTQLPFCKGEKITAFLENFDFYALQSGVTADQKLVEIPFYFDEEQRVQAKVMVKEAKNEGTGWEGFVAKAKEEYRLKDPEQSHDRKRKIDIWFDNNKFSLDPAEFMEQRRRINALFEKASITGNSTEYTQRVLQSIDRGIRSALATRLGVSGSKLQEVASSEVIKYLTEYMKEQSMDDDDDDLDSDGHSPVPAKTKRTSERKPVKKAKPDALLADTSKVHASVQQEEVHDTSAAALDELSRKFDNLLIQNQALMNAQVGGRQYNQIPVNYTERVMDYGANYGQDAYPVYQQGVAPQGARGRAYDPRSAPPQRGMGRGGQFDGSRGGMFRAPQGWNTDLACFYCANPGHRMNSCPIVEEDESRGIVHRDRRGRLAYGTVDNNGGPINSAIFNQFRIIGKVRNAVWSFLKSEPGWQGASAMRAYEQESGLKVETGTRYLFPYHVDENHPIGAQPPRGATGRVQTPDQQPVSVVEVVYGEEETEFGGVEGNAVGVMQHPTTLVAQHGVKRVRIEDVPDEEAEDGVPARTFDRNPSGAEAAPIIPASIAKGKEKEQLKNQTTSTADIIAQLVSNTTTAALEAKIKLSLQEVAYINKTVAGRLAAAFADMAESVETTIRIDKHGRQSVKDRIEPSFENGEEVNLVGLMNGGSTELIVPTAAVGIEEDNAPFVAALGRVPVILGDSLHDGRKYRALLDSGSAANLVSLRVAHLNGFTILPTSASSKSVHGTVQKFVGKVDEGAWLGGQPFRFRAFVTQFPLPGGDEPLLGMPFIRGMRMNFLYTDEGMLGSLVIGRTRVLCSLDVTRQQNDHAELIEGSTN